MARVAKPKYTCSICGKQCSDTNYYSSHSIFFSHLGKLPYCKQCVEDLYQQYYKTYKDEHSSTPEKKAIRRLCMAFDIFYSDEAFDSAMKQTKEKKITIVASYMKNIHLSQFKGKSYDTTLLGEKFHVETTEDIIITSDINKDVIDFFGEGFTKDDYKFLKKEYNDWVSRHECKTKAQEEVFKRICFKQLEILKATRKGEDTKNLDATFQNLLETAKLQPKQNSGDATADNQTFGTLIDKWENTRPIPEIDEELRDVDKIGVYLDTFFKGHTCKMLNVKNAFSNLYSSMMKKFTVNKPEYNLDEDDYDSEINFDMIFGDALSDSSDE